MSTLKKREPETLGISLHMNTTVARYFIGGGFAVLLLLIYWLKK